MKPGNQVQFWFCRSPVEKFFVTVDRAYLNQGRLPHNHDLEEMVLSGMSTVGRLVELHGLPLLNLGGRWVVMEKPPAARYNVGKVVRFIAVDVAEASMNPNEWVPAGSSDDNRAFEFLLYDIPGIRDLCVFPDKLAALLAGAGTRGDTDDLRKVRGMLLHPVHGDCADWIYNFHGSLPDPEPGYPHLRALFSGMKLTPEAHVVAYTFLLACFHEASLSGPRPILFVDSWQQSRGKSQICQAITTLIDGTDRGMSLPRDIDSARQEIVAHFLNGRSGFIDNIDGKRNWNHALLASMATGNPSARRLYDKNTSDLSGTITMLNSVYGSSSFHGDMLTRFYRVELQGLSDRKIGLVPAPWPYAEEHRLEIIAEILAAHQAASTETPEGDYTRFKDFDLAGLRAYSVVFEARVDEARRRLIRASDGAQSLRTDVVEHCYCNHHSRFYAAHERVFRGTVWASPRPEFAPKLGSDTDGATALGLRLEAGKWIENGLA
ncbi:MAG: hypothetical protein V3S83_12495 [Gemmatimonadota bacterium]